MPTANRWTLVACAMICLGAGSIPQSQGDTLIVTRKQTKLRAQKRVFAPGVQDLVEGDKLEFLAKDGAWISARYQQTTGWLHGSDVSERKDVRLSGQGVRETYTAAETGAAKKGFNPQVERQYRLDNPALNAAFARVDELEKLRVDENELRTFLQQGGLIVEAR